MSTAPGFVPGIQPAPVGPWAGIAVLTVVNLVPLWMVVGGHLETADLLMSYAIDTGVLLVLVTPALPRVHGWVRRTEAGIEQLRAHAAVLGGGLLLVGLYAMLAVRVVREVTWDLTSLLSISSVCLSVAIGLAWTLRRQRRSTGRWKPPVGAFLWRALLLVIGGAVGLGTAEAYTDLRAHGWDPAPLGDGWAYPFGQALVRAAIALDVSAALIPAILLVTVRTVNEVLFEVWRVLGDRDAAREESAG